MKRAAFIISAIFLSACAPIPHMEKMTPTIDGFIYMHGEPAEGAKVSVCEHYSDLSDECDKYTISRVNSDGYFRIDSTSEFRWMYVFAVTRRNNYGFAVEYRGEQYQGCNGWNVGKVTNVHDIKYELSDTKDCDISQFDIMP